jgi:hypothetical protein
MSDVVDKSLAERTEELLNNMAVLVDSKYDMKSAIEEKGGMVDGGLVTYAAAIRGLNDKIILENGTKLAYSNWEMVPDKYDLSNITEFAHLFQGCEYLKQIPDSILDKRSYNTSHMFDGCKNLTSIPSIDTSLSYDTSYMFKDLNVIYIPNIDVHNSNNVSGMFEGCKYLTQIDSDSLDTSNSKYFDRLFYNCRSLLSIPSINTSSISNSPGTRYSTMVSAFEYCTCITHIPYFDLSQVGDISNFCYACTNLITIPDLNYSKVSRASSAFTSCRNLTQVSNLDLPELLYADFMFSGCSNLETISLNTPLLRDAYAMFTNCSNLTTVELSTRYVTGANSMFHQCNSLVEFPEFELRNCLDIGNICTGCTSLVSIPRLNLSSCRSAHGAFEGCTSLTDIGGFRNLRCSMNLSDCPLTKDSLLNVINDLDIVRWESLSAVILTLGEDNLSKLSDEDIFIATNKGWVIY